MNDMCRQYESKLDAFADDALSEDEAAGVASHLDECKKCSAEVRTLRAVTDTLSTLPYHTCPDRVIDPVYEATIKKKVLKEAPQSRWDWSLIFGWRAAVAGMAAASIALLLFLNPFGDQNGALPGYYHPDELAGAGDLAKWSLLYIAQTIKESERDVVHGVLVEGLPRKIRYVVKSEIQVFKGEEP
jgi:hypothetical protein